MTEHPETIETFVCIGGSFDGKTRTLKEPATEWQYMEQPEPAKFSQFDTLTPTAPQPQVKTYYREKITGDGRRVYTVYRDESLDLNDMVSELIKWYAEKPDKALLERQELLEKLAVDVGIRELRAYVNEGMTLGDLLTRSSKMMRLLDKIGFTTEDVDREGIFDA